MNFNKLNTDQIVSVKSYIKYVSTVFEYRVKPKYFKFLYPKEGWYFTQTLGSSVFKTTDEIESSGKFFVKDGRVCYYPHIEIKMGDGTIHTKYFKTEEDLKEFYDTYLAPLNLIDA